MLILKTLANGSLHRLTKTFLQLPCAWLEETVWCSCSFWLCVYVSGSGNLSVLQFLIISGIFNYCCCHKICRFVCLLLQLEILTNLATESNIATILREFQVLTLYVLLCVIKLVNRLFVRSIHSLIIIAK